MMDRVSLTKHIGILGTAGTISSRSYSLEIEKMFPHIKVTGEACPMWAPLVENNEFDSPGADYFVKNIWIISCLSTHRLIRWYWGARITHY